MWNSWFKSVRNLHSSCPPACTDELTKLHEVRERCLGYVVFNNKGKMDNVLYSGAGDLFKVKIFLWFSQSLDFVLVSLELFVPDVATDQCCTCKTTKHYWIREVMHSYNYY